MTFQPAFDWMSVKLVVFDVDGTLYDQRTLRLRMASLLALHAITSCSLRTVKVLMVFRRLREQLADREYEGFEPRLVADTAEATGESVEQVRNIATEWLEKRPLPYLINCRYRGLDALFAGLRRHGKKIGILSDYPPREKLAALGLAADILIGSQEESVGVLKPHPRGLLAVMERAGCTPDQTVLIGDRIERDGMAALRAGCRSLIRSSQPGEGWLSFSRFDDALFAPVLA